MFFLLAWAGACSSSPQTLSSAGLQSVLQQYLDQQSVNATLRFVDEPLVCRIVNGRNSCSERTRAQLEMLLKGGLLGAAAQVSGVTTYRITAQGTRYIRPLGIVGEMKSISSSGEVDHKFVGYAIDEARTAMTKIERFTIPGRNSERALSTTVWFVVENQPREWVKPFLAQEAPTTHIGETTEANADLVLTNVGWRVLNVRLNWPLTEDAL